MNSLRKLRSIIGCNRIAIRHQATQPIIEPKKYDAKQTTVVDYHVRTLEAKIGNSWWDVNGFAKALHAYNGVRIPIICDGLRATNSIVSQSSEKNILKGVKILDIGCGGGILSEALAKLGAHVNGVDASESLIQVAKDHADTQSGLNLQYINSTIEDFSTTHVEAFDAVVASEVIEHIENKDLFIEKCLLALKPGGSIFFTTFSTTLWSRFYGIFVLEDVLKIIPKGTHEYKLFINSENLSKMLEKYNCKTVAIKGLHYNPFKNHWYRTDHLMFSYGLQAVKNKNKN